MPLWGKRDSFAITGTAAVTNSSPTVTGSGTSFTTELNIGDMVTIASVKYRVAAIANTTSLTLGSVYAGTTASGLTITGQDTPRFLDQTEGRLTFGADKTEVGVAANKGKGFNSPGWVRHNTYTDANGKTRYRTETLVAVSSMTAAAAGDAGDDSTLADS